MVALELSPASDRAGVDALDGPGVDSCDGVFVQGLGFLDASLTTLDQDEPEGCLGGSGAGNRYAFPCYEAYKDSFIS